MPQTLSGHLGQSEPSSTYHASATNHHSHSLHCTQICYSKIPQVGPMPALPRTLSHTSNLATFLFLLSLFILWFNLGLWIRVCLSVCMPNLYFTTSLWNADRFGAPISNISCLSPNFSSPLWRKGNKGRLRLQWRSAPVKSFRGIGAT